MQLNVPLTPGPGSIQLRRPLTGVGVVTAFLMDSFSDYHALQVKLDKRLSHGMQFLASYTWQKSMDLTSNELTGNTVIPTNLKFDYGPSNFDIQQNLTVSYLYALPFGVRQPLLNSKGLLNDFFGGWTINGATTCIPVCHLHRRYPATMLILASKRDLTGYAMAD
jgi:hypothetical protein